MNRNTLDASGVDRISPAECPLPQIIEARARSDPEATFYQGTDESSRTFTEFHQRNLDWAAAFHALGVRRGDTVVTMLPISAEAHHAWLGLAWIGAIEVPINHDYKGQLLNYAIEQSGAKVVVATSLFAERFRSIASPLCDQFTLVVADTDDSFDSVVRTIARSEFFETHHPVDIHRPESHDIACILYTSGTTGPSKGVRVPWRQLYYTAVCPPEDAIGPGEAFYSTWPAYHASGKSALYLPALQSARLVARDVFSASAFWHDVRKYRCTFALLGGPLVHFLLAQPAKREDTDHMLRGIWSSPLSQKTVEFSKRFGVKIATAFGMTEIGTPISSGGWLSDDWASCGRVRVGRPGFEVRVVDEYDEDVPTGTVGELVVRTDEPWALNAGYHRMPEKTASAWRNGWFHTGDAFRMDEQQRLFYVDRTKDCIRRRGENISSFEVERYVLEHPDIRECAAVGVASEYGEEDVKICVVAKPGYSPDHEALFRFLMPRMPRFMLPRYIEFHDELPKTEATLRVKKNQLRETPRLVQTWDREQHGIALPRES